MLTHERIHNSVRSGVYKLIQNFEKNVQHKTLSAHHEVRGIFFLLNLKFYDFITNKSTIYIISAMETSHVFYCFVQFMAVSYCTYNFNNNSKLYQQNLQSYIHFFLYPSFNFPFESELFIT
jgi:hypothetical protein